MALSDYLPDFSDPNQMAIFGALGNVLATGAAPRYAPNGMGVTGGSVGNALAALAGAGLSGAVKGAQGAQQYKSEDIGNQNKQLMLDYYKNMYGQQPQADGSAPSAYGGVPQAQGQANPLYAQYQRGMMLVQAPDPSGSSQKAGAALLDTVQKMIGPGKVPNPDGSVSPISNYSGLTANVAGQTKNAEAQNSIVSLPGGRQVPGSQIMPPFGGGSFGSLAPQALQQGVPGQIPSPPPPAAFGGQQNSANIPPVPASALFPQGINPNDPVQVAGATEAAKRAAELQAAGPIAQATAAGTKAADIAATQPQATATEAAEADKGVAQLLSRLPSMKAKLAQMQKLAPQTMSGAGVVDEEGQPDGWRSSLMNVVGAPSYAATKQFKNLNDQLFVQEIPAMMNGASGMRMDIPLVKGVKGASGVDLQDNAQAKNGVLNQLSQNFDQTRDNALSYYKNLTGKDYDLSKAFSNPDQIKQAFQTGVITKSQAKKLLQSNHGFE